MDAATAWMWQELDPEAAKDPETRAREEREALETSLREAYQRGVQDGLRQGAAQAEARLARTHDELERLIDEFGEASAAWKETMADSMAAVATAIARQILDREVRLDPEVVATLIDDALEVFPLDHAIRIRVSPADLALLKQSGATDRLTDGRWAQWTAEESLAPGSFLVEGPETIIDGRIDHALENLYRKMTGA